MFWLRFLLDLFSNDVGEYVLVLEALDLVAQLGPLKRLVYAVGTELAIVFVIVEFVQH